MCGYCMERIALDILKRDVQGSLQMKDLGSDMNCYFYLRETSDFLSAADRVRRSRQHRTFFSDPPGVAFDRGLEILFEHGFDSSAYQRLLKKPFYREEIIATCTDSRRRDFETLSEGLQVDNLGLLYQAETFFWGNNSKVLRNLDHILPACRNILKHYISWWLDGKALDSGDLLAKLDNLGHLERINAGYAEQTSEASLSRAQDFRFGVLFTAVYFSILMVGSCSAGKKMLLAIAQRNPAETPGPCADDLWLQRVAALRLYDLEGFEAFSRRVTTLHATSLIYIDLMRGFTKEQRELLLDIVTIQPDATQEDLCDKARWLRERELL